MSTRLKASLEAAIQRWADRETESDDWPEGMYWPDTMTLRMADAAFAVLLVNAEGQKFAKEQE